MDFVILGSLEVIEGGRSLPLGGVKQRALLAILLLHANQVVSRDRLIEGIWTGRLPAGPMQTLDAYVSRLRKLLGPDRILRRADGFALTVAPQELDLDRFEDLAFRGEFAEALAPGAGTAHPRA
jgi:DNA-binding SARP family transcriptional activator